MYQLGRPTHHSHKIAAGLLFLIISAALVGIIWLIMYLRPENTVSQAQPYTSHVTIAKPTTKKVSGEGFTLYVPATWQPAKNENTPYKIFAWRGVGKIDSPRLIQVYVNTIPSELAFNRLLPVKADDSGLSITGDISENCVNFTDKKGQDRLTGAAPAKWAGINFLCDMSKSLRNVVGIGSNDGMNYVQVKGDSRTVYKFLLVYTDHSDNPEFNTFTDIINTFKAR